MSPPVNFFSNYPLEQQWWPNNSSLWAYCCFHSVLINVFWVLFLLWELSFPCSLQFLLGLCVPLLKPGSFISLYCWGQCSGLSCSFNAAFVCLGSPKRKAKHRFVPFLECPVLPQLCQLCLGADVEPSQQKSPGWDLTEASLMPWKLSCNLSHGKAGRGNNSSSTSVILHEFVLFHEFSLPCSWFFLGNC